MAPRRHRHCHDTTERTREHKTAKSYGEWRPQRTISSKSISIVSHAIVVLAARTFQCALHTTAKHKAVQYHILLCLLKIFFFCFFFQSILYYYLAVSEKFNMRNYLQWQSHLQSYHQSRLTTPPRSARVWKTEQIIILRWHTLQKYARESNTYRRAEQKKKKNKSKKSSWERFFHCFCCVVDEENNICAKHDLQ